MTQLMVIDPNQAVQVAAQRKAIVAEIRRTVLVEGVDYGVIPGTDKPTLYKSGAERLCAGLGFNPVFTVTGKIEQWDDENPLFHYEVTCTLIHIDSGLQIATGIGSCNSKESKYRWRWVNADDIPHWLDPAKLKTRSGEIVEPKFAIEKGETSGKYGKPAEYWQQFRDAIENGTARKVMRQTKAGKDMEAYAIGDTLYRIPNDEIFSLVNTLIKMATKRSLVATVLIGANASDLFTQDIEDMPGFGGDVIEGTATQVETRPVFGDNPAMLAKMMQHAVNEGLDDFDLLEALNLTDLNAIKALPCDDTGRAEIKAAIARFKVNKGNRETGEIFDHLNTLDEGKFS